MLTTIIVSLIISSLTAFLAILFHVKQINKFLDKFFIEEEKVIKNQMLDFYKKTKSLLKGGGN